MLSIVTDVAWSVCSLLVKNHEPCKNEQTGLGAVWDMDWNGTKESCIGWGPRSPTERGDFGGISWPVVGIWNITCAVIIYRHTHTQLFNGPLSGTTRVSQKGKTSLDFTEARDSEWQWHQMGHMQVCTSLQTDNQHASTPPHSFSQAECPSCCPTNSIKALKALCAVSMLNFIW